MADYRQLRYRAHLLHQAVADHREAQGALNGAIAVDGMGDRRAAGGVGTVADLLGDVDLLVERIHARSAGLRDVAGHASTVHHPQL